MRSRWNLREISDGTEDEPETIWIQDTQVPCARTTVVLGITTSLMLLMASLLR
jgi:hypothetical protein